MLMFTFFMVSVFVGCLWFAVMAAGVNWLMRKYSLLGNNKLLVTMGVANLHLIAILIIGVFI